jgi:hypothetical protein
MGLYGPFRALDPLTPIGSSELLGCLGVCEVAPPMGAGVVKHIRVVIASDDWRPYAVRQLTNASASSAECVVIERVGN